MQQKYHLTQQNPISINNQIINTSSIFSITKQKGCMTLTQIPNLFPQPRPIKIINHKRNFKKLKIFSIPPKYNQQHKQTHTKTEMEHGIRGSAMAD